MDALDALTHDFVNGHMSLSRKIIALHLVYSKCSSNVLQFGQLVSHRPGILRSLRYVDPLTSTEEVHVLLLSIMVMM